MPAKQEIINFPIRKTRSVSSKHQETEEKQTRSSCRSSRRRNLKDNDIENNCRESPHKQDRETKVQHHQTPSKRKPGKTESSNCGCSPPKRSEDHQTQREASPKKSNGNVKVSKVSRKLLSEHQGQDEKAEASSTTKLFFSENRIPLSSPKKNVEGLSCVTRSQSPLKSPLKSSNIMTPLKSPLKSSNNMTPLKSPLKSSNIINVQTQNTDNAFPKSAIKTPEKRFNCVSPFKPRSPLRRLGIDSPLKSPLKRLEFDGVRRSPRKMNLENSPRRSPRKVQSPLRFSSPSTLVSRLSLSSPQSNKKNICVGLFKQDVSAYRAVRQSLNTGTPTTLVCREKQIDQMQEFLTDHLNKMKPGSLYISGAPGTGKTASLHNILGNIQMKNIKQVFLNCMTLKTSGAIYSKIVSELNLRIGTSERENSQIIEKALTTSKKPILIMLDEIDQLDSKNQEVLYSIFEWPALANSMLVLVGIANALDLTDRILPRLQARPTFKPKLLHFPPYSKAEIVKIINQRIQEAGLEDTQVIRPSAVQFLAGKVAAVAGDVRKALDVCRRAVELCEIEARKQSVLKSSVGSPRKSPTKIKMVEIPQVMAIFNEVYGSRVITAVNEAPDSFPLQQKILICTLLLVMRNAKSKDVTLGKFHEVYTRVCKKRQIPGMEQSEFFSLCTLLEARGMLQVKQGKEIRTSKVIMRLNAEEAERTLGDRSLLASVLEDRQSLGKMCKAGK